MNAGVSFGLLPGISPWIIGFALIVLMVILVREKGRWGRAGIGLLILGGAMNLFDRLTYGSVRDPYLFLGIINNNLADYVIGIGVAVYAIGELRKLRKLRNRKLR